MTGLSNQGVSDMDHRPDKDRPPPKPPTQCTLTHTPPAVLPLHTHEIGILRNVHGFIHIFAQTKALDESVRDGLVVTVNLATKITKVEVYKDGDVIGQATTFDFLDKASPTCLNARLNATHYVFVKQYSHGIEVWCALADETKDGWSMHGSFHESSAGVSFMKNSFLDGLSWSTCKRESTFVNHYVKGEFISGTMFLHHDKVNILRTTCKGSLGVDASSKEEWNRHGVQYHFNTNGLLLNTVIGPYHMK